MFAGSAGLVVAAAIASATIGTQPAAAAPRIHAMPATWDARVPLSSHGDCALLVIIAVTCVGAGTPLTYAGGAIQPAPAVYIVFWGWNGRDPSGQAAYQQAFFNGQAEAVRAAAHFGNTTAASNDSTQYVIDTPQGNSTAADITLSTGMFVVQSLWSNSANSGAGGCAI